MILPTIRVWVKPHQVFVSSAHDFLGVAQIDLLSPGHVATALHQSLWEEGGVNPLRLPSTNTISNACIEWKIFTIFQLLTLIIDLDLPIDYIIYRRSGNFRVKKLSYDKFSCKKFSQEWPLTALALIVHANFRKINFRSRHRPRKYFYNENFQIYGLI